MFCRTWKDDRNNPYILYLFLVKFCYHLFPLATNLSQSSSATKSLDLQEGGQAVVINFQKVGALRQCPHPILIYQSLTEIDPLKCWDDSNTTDPLYIIFFTFSIYIFLFFTLHILVGFRYSIPNRFRWRIRSVLF